MNLLLVIFTILVILCIVFLLMYLNYFRKLKGSLNTVENFQIVAKKPDACIDNSDEIDEINYIEEGVDIIGCYNYINMRRPDIKNKGGTKLYPYNGTTSFLYLKDFYHNFMSIVLLVSFITLEDTQTLIDTQFYKVQMEGSELKLIYKLTGDSESIFNLVTDTVYEISIDQNSDSYEIILILKEYENAVFDDETDSIEISVKMSRQQMCQFSKGNDIYIGCEKKEKTKRWDTGTQNHLNAEIGVIEKDLKINKDKYDEFLYKEDTGGNIIELSKTEPSAKDFPCSTPPADLIITDPVITELIIPEVVYENYIEITFENEINDLKLKYKKSIRESDTFTTSLQQQLIENFFKINLRSAEEIYSHPKLIQLKKREEEKFYFNDSYSNIGEYSSSKYLGYYLNVKNTVNQEILETMTFIDLYTLRDFIRDYKDVNMLLLGSQTDNSSFINFLKIDKPIVLIIFRNSEGENYEYKVLDTDIEKFYEIQKDFTLHIKRRAVSGGVGAGATSDEFYYGNFKTFIAEQITNNKKISLDLDKTVTPSADYDYSQNFFRIYENNLGLNMILNKYVDAKNTETNFVNYYSDLGDQICEFSPMGETLYECKQLCGREKETCSDTQCSDLCNNCKTLKCKWNIRNLNELKALVPSATKLRGFAGDTVVKLSWVQPFSRFDVETYFILHESSKQQNNFNVYVYKSKTDLNEYIISNLENDTAHIFYLIAKNKFGMSEKSNKVTIIPSANKSLQGEDLGLNSYSDSIQNYYKSKSSQNVNFDFKGNYNNIIKTIEINQLKKHLMDKLYSDSLEENTKYNINVY